MKEDRRANGSQGTWWVWARSKDSPGEVGGAPSHFAAPRKAATGIRRAWCLPRGHQPSPALAPRTCSALTCQRL